MKTSTERIAVEGKHIRKDFQLGDSTTRVLKDISLQVARGEFVSIMGPSGSGKSTLLYILGGLDAPTAGSVLLDGMDISHFTDEKMSRLRRQKIGFVFQFYNLIPNLNVEENILLPLLLDGKKAADYQDRLAQLLETVGLSDRRRHTPRELSGGQQQRVAIARALAMRPEVMLFDEPTSALDPEMIGEVLEVMIDLAKQGMTMVVVSHEMSFIREVADKVLVLADGVIIEEGSPQEVFTNPRHERCRSFLSKIL